MEIYEGHCLCGECRYFIRGKPIDAGYCHCNVCRRACGGPVVVWATFLRTGFESLGEPLGEYVTSSGNVRKFCKKCGSSLLLLCVEEPTTIDVNVASLVDPQSVSPDYHIWCQSQLSWFDTRDSLPRFGDRGPDSARGRAMACAISAKDTNQTPKGKSDSSLSEPVGKL